MAITARLIGKLGGADIEAIPVSMSGTGNGTEHLLHRVTVPSGERRMIVVEGVFTQISYMESYYPLLVVGDQKSSADVRNLPTSGVWAGGGVLSQTGNVSLETVTTGTQHDVSFSGTLYIVPLD